MTEAVRLKARYRTKDDDIYGHRGTRLMLEGGTADRPGEAVAKQAIYSC